MLQCRDECISVAYIQPAGVSVVGAAQGPGVPKSNRRGGVIIRSLKPASSLQLLVVSADDLWCGKACCSVELTTLLRPVGLTVVNTPAGFTNMTYVYFHCLKLSISFLHKGN